MGDFLFFRDPVGNLTLFVSLTLSKPCATAKALGDTRSVLSNF